MKKAIKKQEIIDEVKNLERKYFDLVWYARSSSKNDHIKGSKVNRKRIEKLYPEEVMDLIKGNNRSWEHGFNSGMLAGMRYVLSMAVYGKEDAEADFPFLDT
jgi:phage-related tail protein